MEYAIYVYYGLRNTCLATETSPGTRICSTRSRSKIRRKRVDDLPLVQPIELAYRSSAAVHGLMLSKIEKQELVKCVRSGDKGARGQFVLTFMRYCEDLAWKYSQMY